MSGYFFWNTVYNDYTYLRVHCVSKNDTALACYYNFEPHQPILIIFGANVAKKVKVNGTLK